MSDQAYPVTPVQGDEPLDEYRVEAEGHQSSTGDGVILKPPARQFRSYDRQFLNRPPSPSYIEDEITAYVRSNQQQQQWAGHGDNPRQNGQIDASYHKAPHQQFQQPFPQQPAATGRANTTVVRVPTYQVVQAPPP